MVCGAFIIYNGGLHFTPARDKYVIITRYDRIQRNKLLNARPLIFNFNVSKSDQTHIYYTYKIDFTYKIMMRYMMTCQTGIVRVVFTFFITLHRYSYISHVSDDAYFIYI